MRSLADIEVAAQNAAASADEKARAAQLLELGEEVLEHWIRARGDEPTNETREGFRILAFPANNFLRQEPGTNSDIKTFCVTNFDITFDLFAKILLKGRDQAPLYRFLTTHPDQAIAGKVAWNFQKYLVGRDGRVIAKFGARTPPTSKKLIKHIEEALAAGAQDLDS